MDSQPEAIVIHAEIVDPRDRLAGEAVLTYARHKGLRIEKALALCLESPAIYSHAKGMALSARRRAYQAHTPLPTRVERPERPPGPHPANADKPFSWKVDLPGWRDANGGPNAAERAQAGEAKVTLLDPEPDPTPATPDPDPLGDTVQAEIEAEAARATG